MDYQTILPEAHKDSYTEYDNVDFILSFENKKLLCNTIRLEANLVVLKAGTPISQTDLVYLEPSIGAHNIINTISTDFQNAGSMETLREYNRYCKMRADCTLTNDDMLNSENVCELRAPNRPSQAISITPYNTRDVANANNIPDFSIKLDFMLNNVSSKSDDVGISYQKTGAITIRLRLERIFGVLAGPSVDATTTYQLTNLKMSYFTKPDDGKSESVYMGTKLNLKQTLQSGFSSVSTKVPAVASAVSCSFIKQSHEYVANLNHIETETVPLVDRLVFAFNDSTNKYITFPIEHRMEILERYLQSMSNAGVNNVSLEKVEANQAFGVGLAFGEIINLANQKFQIQLTSGIKNTEPYVIYMYFHSVREL
jgi:hypothetical protein